MESWWTSEWLSPETDVHNLEVCWFSPVQPNQHRETLDLQQHQSEKVRISPDPDVLPLQQRLQTGDQRV